MAYIENIVIGKPICSPELIFAYDQTDWESCESEKTYYTEERYLPKILVKLGIYPSISEIRRNKPEFMLDLKNVDFVDGIKVKKKRWL